jgi:isocitrate dehydrogenase
VAHAAGGVVNHGDILDLLRRLTDAGIDVIKTENLCTFDGVAGFALAQGQ